MKLHHRNDLSKQSHQRPSWKRYCMHMRGHRDYIDWAKILKVKWKFRLISSQLSQNGRTPMFVSPVPTWTTVIALPLLPRLFRNLIVSLISSFLCLRYKVAGGIMFSGCPCVLACTCRSLDLRNRLMDYRQTWVMYHASCRANELIRFWGHEGQRSQGSLRMQNSLWSRYLKNWLMD